MTLLKTENQELVLRIRGLRRPFLKVRELSSDLLSRGSESIFAGRPILRDWSATVLKTRPVRIKGSRTAAPALIEGRG